MKLIGMLLIFNTIFLAGWWVVNNQPNKMWVLAGALIPVFVGIFFIVQDRAVEITMTNVGSIKAAAQQATIDANAIALLKKEMEDQKAVVASVARDAGQARNLVSDLNEKNKQATESLNSVRAEVNNISELSQFYTVLLAAQNDDAESFKKLTILIDRKDKSYWKIAANAVLKIRSDASSPIKLGYLELDWEVIKPGLRQLSIQDMYDILSRNQPFYHSSVVNQVERMGFSRKEKMGFYADILNSGKSLQAMNYAGDFFVKNAGDKSLSWSPFSIDQINSWWTEHKSSINE